MDMEQLLANTKRALELIETHAKTTGENFVNLGGQIKSVADAQAEFEKRVAQIEGVLKTRSENILPGIGDEVSQNGGVNPLCALFPKVYSFDKGRSHSIVSEYTEKKRAAIEQLNAGNGDAAGLEVRDMSGSNDSTASYLIPQVMLPGYIPKARAASQVWQNAGLTIYENLVGYPVQIPIETGEVTVDSVGESQASGSSDLDFGLVTFTPRALKALVKLNGRLMRNAKLAEEVVRQAMIRRFALKMDSLILRGSGSSYEPLGIANQPGINNVEIATNGGPMTLALANEMVISVEEHNLLLGNQKFIGHPRFFNSMKRERIPMYSGDTAGFYVMMPLISDVQLRELLGYDFLKTTVIPNNLTKGTGTALTEGYFGNWSEGYVGIWEDLIFKASDVAGTAFQNSQVWIQAEMEFDFQLPRPAAFSYVNDATIS